MTAKVLAKYGGSRIRQMSNGSYQWEQRAFGKWNVRARGDKRTLRAWERWSGRKAETEPTKYFRADLEDGRSVQFFVNRETGLIVVDVLAADNRTGREILRRIA